MSTNLVLRAAHLAALLLCAMTYAAPDALSALTQRGVNNQVLTRLSEARALAQAGRTTDAIKAYELLVAESPADAAPRIELAQLLSRAPATRLAAETAFKEAVVLAPADFELALSRAANLRALGDAVNASLEYRRAFEISPNSGTALRSYLTQIVRLGAGPVAVKQHAETLAKKPGDRAARLMLAEILRGEARYRDAVEHYNAVLRADSGNVIARLGAAEALLALGYFEQAEQLTVPHAEITAVDARAQLAALRARIYHASGRPEAALLLLRARAAQEKEDRFALSEMADIYRALGQIQREHETLEKLRTSFPAEDEVVLLGRLARARFEASDREAARATCEQLLEIDPRHAVGALGLQLLGATPTPPLVELKIATPARQSGFEGEVGEAALFWNKPDLAVNSLRRALNARPDATRWQLALGAALLRSDAASEAIKVFAQVAVAEGRRPDALLGWAAAELAARKPLKAVEIYEDVTRLDPNNFRALLGLTEAYAMAGEHENAVLLLKELARRAPESRQVNARFKDSLTNGGRPYRAVPAPRAQLLVASAAATADGEMSSAVEPLLLPGDTVSIATTGRARHNAIVTLDDAGQLRLPFLKRPLGAKCLSERELAAALLKHGGSSLKSSAIEIALTKLRRVPLVVGGAVYLPNGYYVRTTVNLREALMLASGANARAGRSVYVARGAGLAPEASCHHANRGTAEQLEVYERDAVEKAEHSSLPKIGPGDLIYVPEDNSALLTGAVERAGFVSVLERPLLSAVIKDAGGVLAGGDGNRLRLRRLLPQGISHQEFVVSLTDIEQQRVGDVVLQAGDVIEVPFGRVDQAGQYSAAAVLRRLASGQQSPPNPNAPSQTVTANPAATKETP